MITNKRFIKFLNETVHESHDMTRWYYNDRVHREKLGRYLVRQCKNCGYEQGHYKENMRYTERYLKMSCRNRGR